MMELNNRLLGELCATVRARVTAVEQLLDALPIGIVLISARGAVLFCNRAGEEILASGVGVSARRGVLRTDGSVARRLRSVVAAVSGSAQELGAVSIPLEGGAQQLEVLVMPVCTEPSSDAADDADDDSPAVALVMGHPTPREPLSTDVLRALYGLTPSEAQVVAALVSGRSVEAIADELEVQPNTVRFHLKSAFGKTGTRGQLDLVRRILTGPALLS